MASADAPEPVGAANPVGAVRPGAGPGPAASPRPWTGAGLGLLVRRTAAEFWQDRVLGLAAEAAFWQLLSFPPLLLAVVGTLGYFGPQIGTDNLSRLESSIIDAAGRVVAPRAVDELVRPALHSVLTNGRADVVSIGFIVSLWSGSTAMATFVNTITIAYDLRDRRSALRSRLLALYLYLGGVAVGVVLLPSIILGPGLIERLGPADVHAQLHAVVTAAYWPVVVLLSLAILATLYHLSVPVRIPWLRALPGAALALGMWLLGSYLLRIYLGVVVRAGPAYGSLSAPIAVLLFFYVTALAVLVGAELNAEIDKLWPSVGTAGLPSRRRNQVRGRSPAPTVTETTSQPGR